MDADWGEATIVVVRTVESVLAACVMGRMDRREGGDGQMGPRPS